MLYEIGEAVYWFGLLSLTLLAIWSASWVSALYREAVHGFWPKDRQLKSFVLFAIQLAIVFCLPSLLWYLDYRALWPYSDWFRLAPVILNAYVKFLEGVCMWLVFLLQVVASILAGVHWPLSLVVAGALIPVLSGNASLFWRAAVAHAALRYFFWLLVGHHGASLLPGEGAYIPLVLLGLLVLMCAAPTPQKSILLSLWAGPNHDQDECLVETTAPQHTFSASGAASGEAVIPDADAANAARIAITADGSTVSYGAMQHAGQFSDSSEMLRESASEAQESNLHASTVTDEALTAEDYFNLVCFWLGAFMLKKVIMLTGLAQSLGWSMQRVQRCVQAVNASCKGIWAHISPSTSSTTLPFPGMPLANVPAAAISQASAAPYRSPRNMHQLMMQQLMSGGPPSVRPLHSTVVYSSPAMQLEAVVGGHGNVSTAVPDQDVASDGKSEVFEDANEEMQPDLLQSEAPLQAEQTATVAGRGTDDFVGWRHPVAHVRSKLRRISSFVQNPGSIFNVSRSRTRQTVRDRLRDVRRRATPACLSVRESL